MAINPELLIAAPILQDYFSDNATDAAMSGGIITCYQDNSRTTLKNWYYQTGAPGSYTYTQLPNPLTLSAAGTITDAMGNDTIPFWYPYSETDNQTPQPYYVTVDNSNGQRQFTRQNFPFVPPQNSAFTSTLRNLLVNNVFWRNVGTFTGSSTSWAINTPYSLNSNTLYWTILAPSQHDGFIANMADMTLVTNNTGAVDVATFTKFNPSVNLPNDVTPEFYLNMTSGSSGTSETIKYIQIPIALHVDNLSGYTTASVTIWSQAGAASANNVFTLNLFQFLGTGVSSPTVPPIITVTPSSAWVKTYAKFDFPPASITSSGTGDDGWFLQIGLPVGVPYNINFAKPSVYLSQVVPSDDFDSYEVVSGTVDSPRVGDIRISINDYTPYGWVPLNNGTIGNASSNATARPNIDTWPLFNKLWNKFQLFTSGTTNVLSQMVNSSGTAVGYGANASPATTAISDWNAGNALTLTQAMGRVLLGTVPNSSQIKPYSDTFVGANSSGSLQINMAHNVNYFNGMPITFTNTGGALPAGLSANMVYYVASFNMSTFLVTTSFANAVTVPPTSPITYINAGTGTSTAYPMVVNSQEGEYGHVLQAGEVGNVQTGTVGSGTIVARGSGSITNTTAAGSALNVTQPGTFVNMYMKL